MPCKFVAYRLHMHPIEVRQTEEFRVCKSLGGGLMEMRIDYGPGYRVYCVQRGRVMVMLLCGGDKRT